MTDRLGVDAIGPEYASRVSTQSYSPERAIEGVRLIDLRLFAGEGGDFCEVTRLGDGGYLEALPGFKPAQISYSLMVPGSVKAWHLHFRQQDVWFVPPVHRLLVGLLDVRRDSPTYDARMRFVLGAGIPRLLAIPPGVAHGVANLTPDPATLFYFSDRQFDSAEPDEQRLPFDLLGPGYWSIPAE